MMKDTMKDTMMNKKTELGIIHVDDWIDHSSFNQSEGCKYARWFLNLARLAATLQSDWDKYIERYKLFCTYKGIRYRVTGASRMGDIWLSEDYTRNSGYSLRVDLGECIEWSDNVGIPSWERPPIDLLADGVMRYATLSTLQELRKTPDMMVTVSAEKLACLMWKVHDTTLALDAFLSKTEFVQEEANKKHEERDDCFPELSEIWSLHRGDIIRKWIDNLQHTLRKAI
jgi:hypothetical protein